MIQFNLLPDVKLEYIKAKRMKRSVLLLAASISAVAVVAMVLLWVVVNVGQKTHLKNLEKDIATDSRKLQENKDLNKILTIQNQMASLPDLHKQKPVAKRTFEFIQQVTPKSTQIANMTVDFNAHTISLSGNTDSISTANTFVDTLKFTKYVVTVDGNKSEKQAFSKVTLASFNTNQKTTTYQINLEFDKAIFESSKEVTLTVPPIVSTRSETERPTLFNTNGETQKAGQ